MLDYVAGSAERDGASAIGYVIAGPPDSYVTLVNLDNDEGDFFEEPSNVNDTNFKVNGCCS